MGSPLHEPIQLNCFDVSGRAHDSAPLNRVQENSDTMGLELRAPTQTGRQVSTRTSRQVSRQVSRASSVSGISEHVAQMLTAPEPRASVQTTAFNLIKNTMGGLSFPDAFSMGSIVPTAVVLFGLVVVNVLTMTSVGYLCHKYSAKSYRELWTEIIGHRYAFVTDVFICLNSLFGCLAGSLLIGSWLTLSLSNLFGSMFDNRVLNTLFAAMFVLFPLSMLRDLNALRYTSMAGVACKFVVVCFAVAEMGLHWRTQNPKRTCQPIRVSGNCTSPEVFAAQLWKPSINLLPAMNVIASTLMCHYNIPKMYAEFSGQDPRVFGWVVLFSIAFSGVSCGALGIAGLLRFGSEMPPGDLLGTFEHDFPPEGMMSNTERAITLLMYLVSVLSMSATFPLLFSPLRLSLLQLCGKSVRDLEVWQYTMGTLGLLAFTVFLGLSAPHLTFVQKVKGAICSMSISYIFPGMWLWLDMPRPAARVVVVVILLIIGFSLMIYGVADVVVSYI